MGWLAIASDLDPKTEGIIRELADSGSSESAAVAEALNDIASNGSDQADPEYLAACAENIGDAALTAAGKLDGRKTALDALQALNDIAAHLRGRGMLDEKTLRKHVLQGLDLDSVSLQPIDRATTNDEPER